MDRVKNLKCNQIFRSSVVLIIILNLVVVSKNIKAQQTIEELVERRNEYIDGFRKSGSHNLDIANDLIHDINTYINSSSGDNLAIGQYELAVMNRILSNFQKAIAQYYACIETARILENNKILFDAYLGIARCYMYGTRNHGDAAKAFQQAEIHALKSPGNKQSYEIADYKSQLYAFRGELGAALINGLRAIYLATRDSDLFYAYFNVADILTKYAESCDYRRLIDSKSVNDKDDWGACKRAVSSACKYYEDAKQVAQQLNWDFLVSEIDGLLIGLQTRLFLIEQKAGFDNSNITSVFSAQHVEDVLVNEDFSAGANKLEDLAYLGKLIEDVMPENQSIDPRSLYLLGIKCDLDNAPQQALMYYKKAVDLLNEERISYFDIRQRGTVVESRGELIRDLGLRLLSYGHYNEAFQVFESLRAQGLSKLMSVFKNTHFTKNERKNLSCLIDLESKKTANQSTIINKTIAGEEYPGIRTRLEYLDSIERKINQLYTQNDVRLIIEKASGVKQDTLNLENFRDQVKKSNIPVIFYWITFTNVVVWVISPDTMEIKTVFLPKSAVIDKVEKLCKSVNFSFKSIDETSAKELYTYLIAPFKNLLLTKQIILVPQGPLVNLPFECLINPDSDKYLIEEFAVSYAPNATFAFESLRSTVQSCQNIHAIYDEEISTEEIEKLKQDHPNMVNTILSNEANNAMIEDLLNKSECVHFLMHGEFNQNDPLQSNIKFHSKKSLTAAELIAYNWGNTKLVVLSSCESGRVETRISNEIFGFTWSLLACGVSNLVLSRWIVMGMSNAEWMKTFYNILISENQTPALASQKAMIMLMKTNRKNPYYWVSQQTYGR